MSDHWRCSGDLNEGIELIGNFGDKGIVDYFESLRIIPKLEGGFVDVGNVGVI